MVAKVQPVSVQGAQYFPNWRGSQQVTEGYLARAYFDPNSGAGPPKLTMAEAMTHNDTVAGEGE